MNQLLDLPGVVALTPLHFYDQSGRPVHCDVLLHPAHHWAIATEPADSSPALLQHASSQLAQTLCADYALDHARLVVLTRYHYPSGQHFYVVHFRHFARDFFGQLTLLDPSRRRLHPLDVDPALQMLAEGNREPSVLRAFLPLLPSTRPN